MIAQMLPAGLAVAASVSSADYLVICTADGFKKVPLADLGPDAPPGGELDTSYPGLQDCPMCISVCAKAMSNLDRQAAIIWAPLSAPAHLVADNGSVVPHDLTSRHSATPRAPPVAA